MSSLSDIIANRLRSDRSGEALNTCDLCERALDSLDMFLIAKAYSGGRCVLESVLCARCQMNSRHYASEQSMENIMLYSGRRFRSFMEDPLIRKTYHLEDPSCVVTGEMLAPKDTFELYSFNVPGAALGEDNFLFVGPTAMEQMSELLSEETRRSWGRFTEDLAPDSPEIVVSPVFM